jgi:hypothetical protein
VRDGTRPADELLPATLHHVATLDPDLAGATTGIPQSDGWHRVDQLTGDVIGAWVDELAATHGGHRDVAGSFLGGWVTSAIVAIPTASLVVLGRSPRVTPTMSVRRHADGWFDGVAFDSPRVHVVTASAARHDADVVEHADGAQLVDNVAAEFVDVLAPLLAAIRDVAPFGLRGLWGTVADEVSATATWAARLAALDQHVARQLADSLVSRIAARAPRLRVRPQPFPVRWSGGEDLFQVKGTCCLSYKTGSETIDEQGPAMCTTCPFRNDADRTTRLVNYLQSGGK